MDVRRNQQQDRALAADARVEAFASALERVLPVAQDDAPAPLSTGVGEIAQDTVIVAGRVCSEVDGKLSEVSVQLEGSIARSGGASVTLDLGQCPRFSIFPGQCVAVKGINPTGQRFIAQEITSSYPSE